jgi:hypothetical protein
VEPVRWGILSTARINRALVPPLQASPYSELIAVASRDRARAAAYAAEWGIPRSYGSYAELLDDADVEVIYVSLPNGPHVSGRLRVSTRGSTSCARSRSRASRTTSSSRSPLQSATDGC